MFTKAEWIWLPEANPDTYADFICDFDYEAGDVTLKIAADSNYAVYVNGSLAAFGQYADYPWYKVGDAVDITKSVKPGKNRLAAVVWYYGAGSSTYAPGEAGVIFEVDINGKTVAASSADTLSRLDPGYVQGAKDNISGQMGFTWRRLENRADDAFMTGGANLFAPSRVVDISKDIHPRPNKKLVLGERQPAKISRAGIFTYSEGWEDKRPVDNMQYASVSMRYLHQIADCPANYRITGNAITGDAITGDSITGKPVHFKANGSIFVMLDLEKENVGFLDLDIEVSEDCLIDIGWGEHLDDGVCRTSIRGFFTQWHVKAGRSAFMNPFRRLGCRYIQLFIHAKECTIHYAGIRPTDYPLRFKKYESGNLLRDTIYEVCQRTMACCMHEHYEDCPWREQALYTMDSRNQMLCGYYAFGETEFPRSSLRLIAEGLRENGLLTICYPCMTDLYIPSFSTMYFVQMWEYIKYSADTTLAAEVYDKLERLMSTFTSRITDDGTLPSFSGDKCFWNFYEWQPTLSGHLGSANDVRVEAPLNAMVSLALDAFANICEALGKTERAAVLRTQRDTLNDGIAKRFWDDGRKLFRTADDISQFAILTNALCLLCGAAKGLDTTEILRVLACNGKGTDVIPNTLSMNSFRFDALIAADREKYKDIILNEIDRDYLYMLRNGATTFWETIKGEEDFSEAGSLCHGWSALPIYYYEILGE